MPLLYDSTRRAAHITRREAASIAAELSDQTSGEVRGDPYDRLMYSTDASIYQMAPIAVVLPRTADDVQAAIGIAREHGVPVLPRGGGTSLAGQTCNHAIVLDFSKYMRNVLQVSPEERWARVQPGIVNHHLSRAVAQHGLMYGPDPVTSNRATVGGGIGNNSCGPHSVIYGKTLDHILEVDVLLADGTRTHFAPVGGEQLEDRLSSEGLEGNVYREVRRLAHEHRDEIERRYPKILRRVMGYNLDDFMGDAPMNLARIATSRLYVDMYDAFARIGNPRVIPTESFKTQAKEISGQLDQLPREVKRVTRETGVLGPTGEALTETVEEAGKRVGVLPPTDDVLRGFLTRFENLPEFINPVEFRALQKALNGHLRLRTGAKGSEFDVGVLLQMQKAGKEALENIDPNLLPIEHAAQIRGKIRNANVAYAELMARIRSPAAKRISSADPSIFAFGQFTKGGKIEIDQLADAFLGAQSTLRSPDFVRSLDALIGSPNRRALARAV
ncbi:MAG: FAD-binding oxidoreductase, partial [Chloroflexi bacterium]|nr:FAD-binding oxidoreductase [Chloroflexota bacterium]